MAISDKLTKLKSDLTDSYKELNIDNLVELGDKNTNNLPSTIDNVLDTIKGYIPTNTDTDGVCENAIPLNASVVIDGNSEQDTTSGYNLFDWYNASWQNVSLMSGGIKKNADGTITFTSQGSGYAFATTNITLEAGTYTFTSTHSGNIYLMYGSKGYDPGRTFTLDEETNITIRVYISNAVQGSSITITNIMIEQGSTAHNYEPYTGGIASPNPDYPQEISVVKGTVALKQSGKNLFYLGNSKSDWSVSGNVTDFELNDNGVSMTVVDGGMTYATRNQKFEPNNTYCISVLATIPQIRYIIRLRNSNDTGWLTSTDASISGWNYNTYYKGWYVTGNNVNYSKNVSIPSCLYWVLAVGFDSSPSSIVGTNQSIANIMVELGDTSTTYEPYHEPQTYQISLGYNYLAKVGDVKDELSIDNKGVAKRIGNIGYIILSNYNENWWYVSDQSKNAYQITLVNESAIGLKQSGIGLSNYFIVNGDTSSEQPHIVPILQDGIDYIRVYSGMSSLDEFKTFIKSKEVEFYYPLATPTEETLQTDTPIHMWEGTNIFTLDTNIDTDFTVTYYIDAQQALLDTGTEV